MGAERNKHSVTHFTKVDTSITISRLKWCVAPGQVLGLWISLSPPLFSVECKHLSCGRCNVRWLTDRSRQTGSGRSDATQEGREGGGREEGGGRGGGFLHQSVNNDRRAVGDGETTEVFEQPHEGRGRVRAASRTTSSDVCLSIEL